MAGTITHMIFDETRFPMCPLIDSYDMDVDTPGKIVFKAKVLRNLFNMYAFEIPDDYKAIHAAFASGNYRLFITMQENPKNPEVYFYLRNYESADDGPYQPIGSMNLFKYLEDYHADYEARKAKKEHTLKEDKQFEMLWTVDYMNEKVFDELIVAPYEFWQMLIARIDAVSMPAIVRMQYAREDHNMPIEYEYTFLD